MNKTKKLLSLFIVLSITIFGCKNNTGKSTPDVKPNDNSIGMSKIYGEITPFVVGENSVEMAKNITIGWNLGNTFDATGRKDVSCEQAWGQPKTTKEMIKGLHDSGIKSIRIPVSWHDHITNSETYEIDSKWLNRIKTVVDWALEEDLCVIINMHHDNLSDNDMKRTDYGFSVSKDANIQEKSKKYIENVWKNVAEAFKDYDYRLIFEILNEPRDVGGINFGNEWWVDDANAKTANGIINSYEQAALNQIRATGSKNADRFILVPPYAASSGCMDYFEFPKDSAENRLMLEVHAYTPYNFAMESPGVIKFNGQSELNSIFSNLYNNFVKKGIGVVIDETGATYKKNDSERIKWAEYFFGEAHKKGISCFWWDNGSYAVYGNDYSEKYGYYNRKQQIWYFPEVTAASLKAVGINCSFSSDFDKPAHKKDFVYSLSESGSKITVATNHPWNNGVQDLTKISNYQAMIDITSCYDDSLPVKGDTITIKINGTSNSNIKNLYIRPVDNSQAANWWKELCDNSVDSKLCICKDIIAGEEFSGELKIEYNSDALNAVALCLWYSVDDADGETTISLK